MPLPGGLRRPASFRRLAPVTGQCPERADSPAPRVFCESVGCSRIRRHPEVGRDNPRFGLGVGRQTDSELRREGKEHTPWENPQTEHAEAVPRVRASSDNHKFLPGVRRYRAQGFLPPVLQNESDRFAEIRQTLFTRLALTVGSGHFGAVRDVPWAISLDNRRELVAHGTVLPHPAKPGPPVILCRLPA